MWDGFNKRKFPRLNLHCEIDILSEDPKESLRVTTENLGIGGVCVILEKSLERFSICRVRIDVKNGKTIACDGKVVWIVPTRDSKNSKKRFDTGIEFQGLEPEQAAELKAFIEKEVAAANLS